MKYQKRVMTLAHRRTRIAKSYWTKLGLTYFEYFKSILKEVHEEVSDRILAEKSLKVMVDNCVADKSAIYKFYNTNHEGLYKAHLCD